MRTPRRGPWEPAVSEWKFTRTPDVGVLVGIDHKIWRIVSTDPVNPGNWSERAAEEWVKEGRPDPWWRVPMRVCAVPVEGGKRGMMTIEPWQYAVSWYIVPEHYAVCSQCGEPAPCTEYEGELQAVHEMGQMVERMAVPDGFCPACSEPITSRQKSDWFPGPNLLNPLGRDGVAFHQRRACRSGAESYEKRWAAANPALSLARNETLL